MKVRSGVETVVSDTPYTSKVVCIVVTYNRRDLLVECIRALRSQSVPCDLILVDIASEDDTHDFLAKEELLGKHITAYLRLPANIGGSGGFVAGMEYAMQHGWNWMWLMDNDALPNKASLEALLTQATQPSWIYGSAAVGNENNQQVLCWPVDVLKNDTFSVVHKIEELRETETVASLPFLGFLINRKLVEQHGYPDASFFIQGDDLEYCVRLQQLGVKIVIVKPSKIIHPVPTVQAINVLDKNNYLCTQPAWKRYYEVRNKIAIAKRYYSWKLLTHTLPGILARAVINLVFEVQRRQQAQAYLAGIGDGLLGRMGRRH